MRRMVLATAALLGIVAFPLQMLAEDNDPVVTYTGPTTVALNVATTFTATYSYDGTISSCTFTFGSTTSSATMSDGTMTATYTPTSTGTLNVFATCSSASGGTGVDAESITVVSDTTRPTVSALTPTTATEDEAITLSATYSDNVGVTSCVLYVGGVSQGSMTLTHNAAPPTSGTATKSHTFANSGTATAKVTCTDGTGNSRSGSPVTMTIAAASSADTTEPTVSAVTPTEVTEDEATTLSATYSDDVGVESCTLYIDDEASGSMTLSNGTASASATFNEAGDHTAYVSCKDEAGNTGEGEETDVKVSGSDTTAPTIGDVTPTTAVVDEETEFSFTYDEDVEIEDCYLLVEGEQAGTVVDIADGVASFMYAPSAAGTISVYGECMDTSLNIGAGDETIVTVSAASGDDDDDATSDTTEPTVSAVTPTTATEDEATTLSATYSDDVGVESCTLYVDDESSGSMSLSSGTASASVTFDEDGDHTAYVTCKDEAGNVGEGDETDITVSADDDLDSTAPTIGKVSPTTATQDEEVTFSVTASDDGGIHNCRLYVDGDDQGLMTEVDDDTYERDYTFAASGTFTAYASCGDTSGNLADGTDTTITVAAAEETDEDTTSPTVGAISPSTAVAGVATTLRASVADSGGMGSCVLWVNSTRQGSMEIGTRYATYEYTFDTSGEAIANAYCVDAAGNATRGASTTIEISVSDEEDRAVDDADPGTLLKLPCTGQTYADDSCHAVYYYAEDDEKRHAFPNEKVYYTWYDDFDDVIIVTEDFMASLTLGRNVTYHPGTTMVKFVSVATVYAVGEEGELRAIDSEETAGAIWGDDWNEEIHDISDAFYGNYSFGEDIDDEDDYDPDEAEDAVDTIDELLAAQ